MPPRTADITKVSEVKSSFGPEFKVPDIPKRAIDPKLLSARKLARRADLRPRRTARKFAAGPGHATGLAGQHGRGVRRGQRQPVRRHRGGDLQGAAGQRPGKDCRRWRSRAASCAAASRSSMRRTSTVTRTLGVHRVLQTVVDGQAAHRRALRLLRSVRRLSGDRHRQSACGARPAGRAVDTQRARDLLVKAVAAVRG